MKVSTLEGHSNPIYAVIAHPTKPLFYTAGNDKGIVEWDLNTSEHVRIFKQVKSSVYALEIIDDLNLLIAGCNSNELLFLDTESTKLIAKIQVSAAVFSIKYHPSKKELITSTDDGSVYIINPENKKVLHQFKSGHQKIRSFDFSDRLNFLATASNDQLVRIYDLKDYTFIHEFEAHGAGVGALQFSPDGQKLITGSRDAHLRVWDTRSWACDYNFPAHLFAIYKIIYHPTLPYFATASRDKSIKIWRAEDFSLFRNLSKDKGVDGHRLSVNQIAWSGNGKKLVSVSDDKLVKVWDFQT